MIIAFELGVNGGAVRPQVTFVESGITGILRTEFGRSLRDGSGGEKVCIEHEENSDSDRGDTRNESERSDA